MTKNADIATAYPSYVTIAFIDFTATARSPPPFATIGTLTMEES